MPDDTPDQPGHPYLPHYTWSADPEVQDPERLTAEQLSRNAQHAADREAVERGRGVRLVLAFPIILWSFFGIPAIFLFVLGVVLGAIHSSLIEGEVVTADLAWFIALLVLIEVASIWEGRLLMGNRLAVRSWLAVLVLTAAAAILVTAAIGPCDGTTTEGWVGIAVVWYSVVMAAWQLWRSVRLAPAAERLEQYAP